jgi:CubicO group peptidase (beta-lactamase class C family)
MGHRMRAFGILVAGLLVLGGPACAADADLAAKAEALIQPLVKADRFSGAVLVAKDGKPVFRKGFGLANREWNTPNDPTTKFRIGSITKQFTATAILQLQEAGKLSVDDPASKFYPDMPAAWSGVTIKHLLTHTSGIPDYTHVPNFFDHESMRDRAPEEIIKLTADKPLDFMPGSQYAYDNSGYILLGIIVEKVSGEKYAAYLQRHIFAPLGMRSTGYDVNEAVLAKRAAGYSGDSGKIEHTRYLSMTEPFSAGGLYSTVDDLLTWDRALTAGKVLKPVSMRAMFTDYGYRYGFGWTIDTLAGHRRISHDGGINGFSSQFDRYPDDKLTVIVFSNIGNGIPVRHIGSGLSALYLGVPPRMAAAGGDVLLRRALESIGSGTPDYNEMGPKLADIVRAQLPFLQKLVTGMGDIKSVTLQWTEPLDADRQGTDNYKVIFQNGVLDWNIVVSKGGKLMEAGF